MPGSLRDTLPAPAAWPWLAASTLVHILYFVFLAGAYRWGELSYAYPIMRGLAPGTSSKRRARGAFFALRTRST